jgi:hypothetical protein
MLPNYVKPWLSATTETALDNIMSSFTDYEVPCSTWRPCYPCFISWLYIQSFNEVPTVHCMHFGIITGQWSLLPSKLPVPQNTGTRNGISEYIIDWASNLPKRPWRMNSRKKLELFSYYQTSYMNGVYSLSMNRQILTCQRRSLRTSKF